VVVFPFIIISIFFAYLHAIGQLAAHQPLKIVSHPKNKKLPWPLPAHPLMSEKRNFPVLD